MGFDPSRVTVITFDSFSTLVDVDSTATAVEEYVDDPKQFARRWHSRAATYGMVANFTGSYESYYELHRDALEYLLEADGIAPSADVLDEMTAVYHEMRPFDDVRDGMAELRDAGYELGIVTNGNPSMIDSLLRTTDTEEFISRTISAHEIRRFKPAAELYEYAAEQFDADVTEMAHVGNGQFDVQGAMSAGMQGIWLDRQDSPEDPFGPAPDLTIRSLSELTSYL
ncbi:haloacid dehalogenase type II [Haloplanus sp. GCM10025708]|uniref:haloacid dehalogenase type II n=1 Tax=Haloferacaceae TaxID=1644056 RepID=UPI003608963F